MSVQTDPYTFVNGTVADALQVNARFNPLYTLQNGGIDSANMDLTASFAWTGSHTFTTSATTTTPYSITGNSITTGTALAFTANALTTGSMLTLTSDSSSTGTRSLASIINDNTLATGTTCLTLRNDDTSGVAMSATGRVYIGSTSSSAIAAALQVSGSAASFDAIAARTTDSGAAGPIISTFHDSGSPAAADVVGHYYLYGRDSAANLQFYGGMRAVIDDATSASEDSHLDLRVVSAGSSTTACQIYSEGISLPDTDPPTANMLNRNSGIKAWGHLNSAGTVQFSYNVDEVSTGRTATGEFTIYWDRDFATTSNVVVGMGSDTDSSANTVVVTLDTRAAGSVILNTAAVQDSGAGNQVLASDESFYFMAIGTQ